MKELKSLRAKFVISNMLMVTLVIDVYKRQLEDNAWICVRPSGTEPKIKFYYGVKGASLEDADAKSKALGEAVMAMVDTMM